MRALFNPVSNCSNEWEMFDSIYSMSSPSKEQHHEKASKVLDLVSGHLILVAFAILLIKSLNLNISFLHTQCKIIIIIILLPIYFGSGVRELHKHLNGRGQELLEGSLKAAYHSPCPYQAT